MKNTHYRVYDKPIVRFSFASVFHRILDFKTGLDFYPGPFFILSRSIYSGFSKKLRTPCAFPFLINHFLSPLSIDYPTNTSASAIREPSSKGTTAIIFKTEIGSKSMFGNIGLSKAVGILRAVQVNCRSLAIVNKNSVKQRLTLLLTRSCFA